MQILSNPEVLAWSMLIIATSGGCFGYYETCRRREMRRYARLQEQLVNAFRVDERLREPRQPQQEKVHEVRSDYPRTHRR